MDFAVFATKREIVNYMQLVIGLSMSGHTHTRAPACVCVCYGQFGISVYIYYKRANRNVENSLKSISKKMKQYI